MSVTVSTMPKKIDFASVSKGTMVKIDFTESVNQEQFLRELDVVRMFIRDALITYLMTKRDTHIYHYSIFSDTEEERDARIFFVNRSFEARVENLESVFNEFHVVDATTIHYGSRERGNFNVCKFGVFDYFKNAIWIHEHRLQEFIHDNIPQGYPVYSLFEKYRLMLWRLLDLAEKSR